MKKILITLLFLFLYSVGSIAKPLDLTKEEKRFIKDNPVVSIGMMPDFTPFSYYIEGELVGFEHDLLTLISQKTGLKFERHIDKWTTIYNSFKNKEIDMISSISYKKYREPFTIFTSPYYNIPIMIFVKDDFGEYNGLKSLTGKKSRCVEGRLLH
ncbi:MAG: transporter substrate-binding domain-containing protein [Marinomonas sp.]|uniref:transporter substrate-binding domain-containing protein n=1 Tax=Marinomonas sp. TaxID=1904862 RepID=UPI003F9D7215